MCFPDLILATKQWKFWDKHSTNKLPGRSQVTVCWQPNPQTTCWCHLPLLKQCSCFLNARIPTGSSKTATTAESTLMSLALARLIVASCISSPGGLLREAGGFLIVGRQERQNKKKVFKQEWSGIKSLRSNCISWLIPQNFLKFRFWLPLIILKILCSLCVKQQSVSTVWFPFPVTLAYHINILQETLLAQHKWSVWELLVACEPYSD